MRVIVFILNPSTDLNITLHKKLSFQLRISSVNVTKSEELQLTIYELCVEKVIVHCSNPLILCSLCSRTIIISQTFIGPSNLIPVNSALILCSYTIITSTNQFP